MEAPRQRWADGMSAVRCCRQRRWPGRVDSESISSVATERAIPCTQFVTDYTPRQLVGKQSPVRKPSQPQSTETRTSKPTAAAEVSRFGVSRPFCH